MIAGADTNSVDGCHAECGDSTIGGWSAKPASGHFRNRKPDVPDDGAVYRPSIEHMCCPICSTDAGRALREALLNGPIVVALAATVGPFAVLGLILGWAHWTSGHEPS
jgi:hypothetical protein